jgi:hypothetical protein
MNIEPLPSVAERTQKITFTCTPELREDLEEWANEEGRTMSNLVERIVSMAIDERKNTKKT